MNIRPLRNCNEKPQEGEIVAAGKRQRLDDGELTALDVQAGGHVLLGEHSGSGIKLNSAGYIIMRENDVLGVLAPGPRALPELNKEENTHGKTDCL